MTSTIDRRPLRRVVAVANGKGGVGKTTTSTHMAAHVAAGQQRVLLVDLDPQGNTAKDLGYVTDDRGAGLYRAVVAGTEPHILRDVRPNLDVIPSGVETNELADHMHTRRLRRGRSAMTALAETLAPVAGTYDLVVLDCPPADSDVLQDLALVVAEYVLIPTHSDLASREGMAEIARRFAAMADLNPDLKLLGVLLYGLTSRATTVRQLSRAWIERALGGQAPLFSTTIRHVESVAFDIREQGQLAYELEAAGTRSAKGLSKDFRSLAGEVIRQMVVLEQKRVAR